MSKRLQAFNLVSASSVRAMSNTFSKRLSRTLVQLIGFLSTLRHIFYLPILDIRVVICGESSRIRQHVQTQEEVPQTARKEKMQPLSQISR
jgi:hypothetical protein